MVCSASRLKLFAIFLPDQLQHLPIGATLSDVVWFQQKQHHREQHIIYWNNPIVDICFQLFCFVRRDSGIPGGVFPSTPATQITNADSRCDPSSNTTFNPSYCFTKVFVRTVTPIWVKYFLAITEDLERMFPKGSVFLLKIYFHFGKIQFRIFVRQWVSFHFSECATQFNACRTTTNNNYWKLVFGICWICQNSIFEMLEQCISNLQCLPGDFIGKTFSSNLTLPK